MCVYIPIFYWYYMTTNKSNGTSDLKEVYLKIIQITKNVRDVRIWKSKLIECTLVLNSA